MKRLIYILTLFFIITSCNTEDDDVFSKIETYHLEVGSEWHYTTELITTEFKSDAFDEIINIDTVTILSQVSIIKDTLLNDTVAVKQIKTTGSNGISYRYVNLDKDGIKEYGYFNTGFKSVYVYEKPRLDIQLPLDRSSNWISAYPEGFISTEIEKEVVSSELIRVENDDLQCFKIQIFNEAFTGLTMYEWVSSKGLVKTQMIQGDIVLIGIGEKKYINNTQSTTLVSMKLN